MLLIPVIFLAYIFLVVLTARFIGERLFGWKTPWAMILIGIFLPFVWVIFALAALVTPKKESSEKSSPKKSPAKKSPAKKRAAKK